ncbi:MAG: hypothetical protein QOF53_3925 [Nocardioidaceae bacterium]|nr:hypothetical protein [Nocardioidaceae bacterium]
MTLDEIMRRIVRAHLNTILLCVLIPLAVVLLIEVRTPPTYSAQVRLQTLAGAPGSSTEADGLSSRVLALATTPQVVRSALRAAGQPAGSADALDASLHRVTAERLGESSVVALSVLDHDRSAATRTVSALAQRVTSFMNSGSRGQFDAALKAVNRRSAAALRHRDQVQSDLLHTDGLQARANLQVLLDAAQKDLDQVQAEQSSLTLNEVNRDQVVTVDAANPTVDRVPSELLPRAALGLLLGLLVGLAVAVVQETVRPRIAGIRVLARALDAPILGSTGERSEALAGSMSLAARRQGVETVVLVGVDDRDEKATRQLLDTMLPTRVQEVSSPAMVSPNGGAPSEGPETTVRMTSQVRFTDRYGVAPAEEPTAGVIVVSAGTARRTGLDEVQDIVRAMRWPVVGVVEVAPRRSWLVSP